MQRLRRSISAGIQRREWDYRLGFMSTTMRRLASGAS